MYGCIYLQSYLIFPYNLGATAVLMSAKVGTVEDEHDIDTKKALYQLIQVLPPPSDKRTAIIDKFLSVKYVGGVVLAYI